MGEMRHTYKILIKKPKGNGDLGDLDVDGKIMLK
jgi:hypothetical protein